MIQVVILGTGNVATHLYDAFLNSSRIKVLQVYGRNKKSLAYFSNKTKTTTQLQKLEHADVYIMAVSDDIIGSFSNQIPFSNRLVVHTSGGVDMDVLSKKNRKGVFYPLQTFTKGRAINFSTIPICVEAENASDSMLLKKLGEQISKKVVEISSEERSKLHVAAVFVNNFVNYLYFAGEEITKVNTLDFALLKPLIFETARKIEILSPREAQTGPAKRNDIKTIKKHLHLLRNSTHKKLYKQLTKAIVKQYGKKL